MSLLVSRLLVVAVALAPAAVEGYTSEGVTWPSSCAGQTGGWGYYLEDGEVNGVPYSLDGRVNKDVQVQAVNSVGAAQLKELIEAHVEATGSKKAKAILDDWDAYLPKFKHIYPLSESEAPEVSGIVEVADPETVVPA